MRPFESPYEPPPPAFFLAIKQARRHGLWVKAGRWPKPGLARYAVTVANGSSPLFTSDDINEVRRWLDDQDIRKD